MKREFTAEETRAIIATLKSHDDSHQVDRLGDYGLICTECTVRLYEIAAAAERAAIVRELNEHIRYCALRDIESRRDGNLRTSAAFTAQMGVLESAVSTILRRGGS